jgi:hypothetical protein
MVPMGPLVLQPFVEGCFGAMEPPPGRDEPPITGAFPAGLGSLIACRSPAFTTVCDAAGAAWLEAEVPGRRKVEVGAITSSARPRTKMTTAAAARQSQREARRTLLALTMVVNLHHGEQASVVTTSSVACAALPRESQPADSPAADLRRREREPLFARCGM